MVGGLHGSGGIHHDAVLQFAVHIAVAGGDGLLAFRTMAHRGGAAGVAEIQAGVDVLGIVGDGLRLHTVGVVHAVHRDGGACAHQLVQSRLGVVVTLQSDTCALQSVGDGAEHHLDGVLLTVGGDADGECALDVQGGKVAAVGRVIDPITFFGLDAGEVHDLCRVGLGGEDHLPGTIGVCDVGQPQIRSGHTECSHKAHDHDTERQHTGRDSLLAGGQSFLYFYGSDTRQLLSFQSWVRPQTRCSMPRPPGLQGGQKHSGPTIKYDALFMIRPSIVCNLDSAAEGVISLPARAASARAAPCVRWFSLHPDKF